MQATQFNYKSHKIRIFPGFIPIGIEGDRDIHGLFGIDIINPSGERINTRSNHFLTEDDAIAYTKKIVDSISP